MEKHQTILNDIPLTSSEALSGIFGSISLAAWIFVLVPQVLENYRHRSAAGISLTFLFVWALGDVTNLAGAFWGSLLPLVIGLAIYFCFADVALIWQCVYYNRLNRRRLDRSDLFAGADAGRKSSVETVGSQSVFSDEEEPLLSRRERSISQGSSNAVGLPGSYRRRKSSAASGKHTRRGTNDSLLKIPEDGDETIEDSGRIAGKEWAKNLASIVLICVLGAAGWAFAWRLGVWKPAGAGGGRFRHVGGDQGGKQMPPGAEMLGYFSAVCYLGARIPQILKNWREKSCEGLSLLFFLLSLLGNVTYGAGILCHSVERRYILINLPWLVGSLGTMAEDIMIFVQFHIYGNTRSLSISSEGSLNDV